MDRTIFSLAMSALGVVIAGLAIAFDALRDRRAKRSKRPRWSRWPLDDFHAFNPDFVKPQRTDDFLSQPALTRIAFWNDGNDTIRRQDYVDAYPFRIRARSGVKILFTQVARTNGLGNALSLGDLRDGQVPIEFSYLKFQQGALFDIYHSGDSPYDIALTGEIIDGHKLEYVRPPQDWAGMVPDSIRHRIGDRESHYLALGFVCLAVVLGIVGIIYVVPSSESTGDSASLSLHNPIDLFTVITQVVILPLLIIAGRIRIPKSLRPFDRY